MRNISFMLTQQQVLNRTKTVTRRLGWYQLKPGDILHGVNKSMGLKRGEKQQRLATIRITSVRKERLDAITQDDVIREGFPEMTPAEFVDFFCRSMRVTPKTIVNRIEFEYVG